MSIYPRSLERGGAWSAITAGSVIALSTEKEGGPFTPLYFHIRIQRRKVPDWRWTYDLTYVTIYVAAQSRTKHRVRLAPLFLPEHLEVQVNFGSCADSPSRRRRIWHVPSHSIRSTWGRIEVPKLGLGFPILPTCDNHKQHHQKKMLSARQQRACYSDGCSPPTSAWADVWVVSPRSPWLMRHPFLIGDDELVADTITWLQNLLAIVWTMNMPEDSADMLWS